MKIFENYTGNAMLNNALMTIEALGNLNDVSEITPNILLQLYNEKRLLKLNKRLKSYTMLFTKNGPLHNDKTNGDRIYDALFKEIIATFESDGNLTCEVSGLRFNTTFNKVYEAALRKIGIAEKEIQKKDTNLSRTWFPLIGGLGSDAQALPQAKFTIQIHPICVAILQFLPLSSFLYKGGILLIDSSNFEFAKQYIADNQKELTNRIQAKKSTESIENVRFTKGNYILKAIEILSEKEEYEESYSDLNLWSFSNSGTGASCEIDRVPNSLIRKLMNMNHSPSIGAELRNILNNPETSYRFLEALEANMEWHGLYPNVFGSGKKRYEYNGVSVNFLEAYFKETNNIKQTEYAKYIVYLINKYKSNSFGKYLEQTSAWNEKEYKVDLYSVLVTATAKGEWNLHCQLEIMDNPSQLPVKNTYYRLHRLIHFYYLNKTFSDHLPVLKETAIKTNAWLTCEWLIALIQIDDRSTRIKKDLIDKQDYTAVNYSELFIRAFEVEKLTLIDIISAIYDDSFRLSKNGINELLRIFFNQPEQSFFKFKPLTISKETSSRNLSWLKEFEDFARDYQAYYFNKYGDREAGTNPYNKFKNQAKEIPMETSNFLYWFREATERVNNYLKTNGSISDKWSEDILYNPDGEFAISFAKLAIKFSLLKQLQYSLIENESIVS